MNFIVFSLFLNFGFFLVNLLNRYKIFMYFFSISEIIRDKLYVS